MSQQVDPREVLIYLNELGYTNISAQQLKEFIIDLKKIMKYEHRRRKVLGHNFDPPSSYNYSTPIYSEPKAQAKKAQNDIFEALHNQPTEASKAKIVNKREHHIAVHITQAKKKNINHDHCVHKENDPINIVRGGSNYNYEQDSVSRTRNSEIISKENVHTQTDSSKHFVESESATAKNLRPTSKQSLVSSSVASSKFKKSKTAVLKQTSSIKPLKKSDPVALYHQYQQQWKTIKFPGEDTHLDLRWAVREKLMDGPPVEKVIKKSSSRKKVF